MFPNEIASTTPIFAKPLIFNPCFLISVKLRNSLRRRRCRRLWSGQGLRQQPLAFLLLNNRPTCFWRKRQRKGAQNSSPWRSKPAVSRRTVARIVGLCKSSPKRFCVSGSLTSPAFSPILSEEKILLSHSQNINYRKCNARVRARVRRLTSMRTFSTSLVSQPTALPGTLWLQRHKFWPLSKLPKNVCHNSQGCPYPTPSRKSPHRPTTRLTSPQLAVYVRFKREGPYGLHNEL